MNDFAGKVALVTGASRGIGAATALLLAKRGADVVINYRSKGPRAEQVAQEVRRRGCRALMAQADLTEADQVAAMMAAIGAECGATIFVGNTDF